jgi:hypothetical protein
MLMKNPIDDAHHTAPIDKDTPTSKNLIGQEQNLHTVEEKRLAPESEVQPAEGQEDNSVTEDILHSLESPETEHKNVVASDATENDQNSSAEKPLHEEAGVVKEAPHEEAVVDNEAASNTVKISLESPGLVEDGEVHTPEHHDASISAAEQEDIRNPSHETEVTDDNHEVKVSLHPDVHDSSSHTEDDKPSDETPSIAEIKEPEVLEDGPHAEPAASELQKPVSQEHEVEFREASPEIAPEALHTDHESTNIVNSDEGKDVKNDDSYQVEKGVPHVEEEHPLHSAETLGTAEVDEPTSHEDASHSVHALPDVASHEPETEITKRNPEILPGVLENEKLKLEGVNPVVEEHQKHAELEVAQYAEDNTPYTGEELAIPSNDEVASSETHEPIDHEVTSSVESADLLVRDSGVQEPESEVPTEKVETSGPDVSLANGSDPTNIGKLNTESMPKEDPEDVKAREEIAKLNAAQSEVKLEPKEDPEDVKAREEIARLNAELMKAATEEEEKDNTVSQDDIHAGIPALSSEVVAEPTVEEKQVEPEGSAPNHSLPNHQNIKEANMGHISPSYELGDSFIPPIESHRAQDLNTEHFIEMPEPPSTPIHHDIPNRFAESPVTVLNADDLFAEDDEDDDQVPSETSHRVEAAGGSVAQRPAMPGSFVSENTQHGSEARGAEISSVPETQYQVEEHPGQHPTHRRSGIFASLVDALKHDVPLVSQLVGQEYSSLPEDDLNNEPATFDTLSSTHQETPQLESEEEFPLRPVAPDAGLHIRTHTADTVPSFERFAQSDEEDSPTTPSDAASSPFLENPHEEPNIRSSWSPPRDNLNTHVPDQEMKPQASPLQAEFDPYNAQTYPNYVTPKASIANLRSQGSPEDPNDSPLAQPATPPPRRPTPTLDTSNKQSFPETYDSPISTTHSHPSSPQISPTRTPSRLQRRPTLSTRPSSLSRTPTNSPLVPTSTSFFQKTRSLFESQAQSPSPPPPRIRPRSGVYNVSTSHSSPSASASGSPGRSRTTSVSSPTPPVQSRSRPSSLYGQSPRHADGGLVPKSLDGNGKPPSPAFVPTPQARSPKRNSLPYSPSNSNGKRNSMGYTHENRNGSPFSDNRSRLAGLGTGTQVSGGLEDSVHNPARFSNKRGREGDEIGGGERDRLLDNGY